MAAAAAAEQDSLQALHDSKTPAITSRQLDQAWPSCMSLPLPQASETLWKRMAAWGVCKRSCAARSWVPCLCQQAR